MIDSEMEEVFYRMAKAGLRVDEIMPLGVHAINEMTPVIHAAFICMINLKKIFKNYGRMEDTDEVLMSMMPKIDEVLLDGLRKIGFLTTIEMKATGHE
jgi:hypothetical protein